MIKNYKITVAYDGTKYNGWQKQGNTSYTLQEKFETVLFKMCGKKTEIFASGRTDRGVHALGQTANFKCDTPKTPSQIMAYLNEYLPEDVAVLQIEEMPMDFHCRLHAKRKTYVYTIALDKRHVFSRKFVYHTSENISVEAMCEAAEKLLGTHDFHGFSSVKKTKKSTVRTLYDLTVTEEDGLVKIRVTGNGFLYHMVRIIAGTLYDIGRGALSPCAIDNVLQSGNREEAGTMLPAAGLTLEEVRYE